MKVTSRNMVRAALVLAAAGAIGAFGACGDNGVSPPPPPPVPPPPPPPPTLVAPKNLTATPNSATQITLNWQDSTATETGFRIDRCTGPACTNFAKLVDVAANAVTFADEGLTASTQYSYRARAFTATDTSAWTATVNATTLGVVTTPGFVMIGAGEITSCNSSASNLTADLIEAELAANPDAIIYTAGNNLTDTTAGASFEGCFEPRWGFKSNPNFHVALGQRDYDVGRPAGGSQAVYAYFGAQAGEPNGWYAFDVGTNWRVIVLNSATWQHGTANLVDRNSAQNSWLDNDLVANARKCTVAIFNTRRYYSYGSMENANAKTVWNILHTRGAEIVLSGTDKYYERWAPQNHDMARDDATGVRQFIVGTGGRTLDNFSTAWLPVEQVPNLEVRDASTHGVLKLTLKDNSYDWEFIPTTPGGFTDSGTATCH